MEGRRKYQNAVIRKIVSKRKNERIYINDHTLFLKKVWSFKNVPLAVPAKNRTDVQPTTRAHRKAVAAEKDLPQHFLRENEKEYNR